MGLFSAASSTTSATSASPGGWPPISPAAASRCGCAIDDARALAWMAPDGCRRRRGASPGDAATAVASDVLVETFGCGWPDRVSTALATGARAAGLRSTSSTSAPSRSSTRSHGLPSPRFTAEGEPLPTWFFYPGFGEGTGGLLREPTLLERRQAFGDGRGWLARPRHRPRERRALRQPVLLSGCAGRCLARCLVGRADPASPDAGRGDATSALAALGPGWPPRPAARRRAAAAVAGRLRPPAVGLRPRTSCAARTRCVRAIWAGRPFVWQAYVQQDGAHRGEARGLPRPVPCRRAARRWRAACAGCSPPGTAWRAPRRARPRRDRFRRLGSRTAGAGATASRRSPT